jgi:predicted nicotinamide N-methyase
MVELAAAAAPAEEKTTPKPASPPLRCFDFGSASVWIQETSYADGGLGWRVWPSAARLCGRLAAAPGTVAGRRVLELGSGVGLAGLLASRLGAASVVLSDALPGLLHALVRNAAAQPPSDPSCAVSVRHFLWEDDYLDGSAGAAIVDPDSLLASQLRRLATDALPAAPCLEPASERVFDLIIAADVLYDWGQRRPLPRVLARRLARPHGRALLACPVRDRTLLDAFVAQLTREGLWWSCEPAAEAAHGASDGRAAEGKGEDGEGEALAHVDIDVWWPEAEEAGAAAC